MDNPQRDGESLADRHIRQWRVLEFSMPTEYARMAVRQAKALHVRMLGEMLAVLDEGDGKAESCQPESTG